jgi:ketosteroid isomerase-like protein
MDEIQRRVVVDEVTAAMRSFEAAERALDAERLIAHFAPVPDFHVYNDGQRVSYDVMTAGLRQAFAALRVIEGGFSDIHVIVLAADAALATATFREAVSDAEGKATRVRGAASWLWRKLDSRWQIVYGQADHYPDEGGQVVPGPVE